MKLPPEMSARLRSAYESLPAEKKDWAHDLMKQAHDWTLATGPAPSQFDDRSDFAEDYPEGLALAYEDLFPDEANDDALRIQTQIDFKVPHVTKGGSIYGTGKYEMLDLGWVGAFITFLEHLLPFMIEDFNTNPAIIDIPDTTDIAIIGDWGCGEYDPNPSPAVQVGRSVANLDPQYTIHLGDVYYSGTEDEERERFLRLWPAGSMGSFALNSNHEMYCGAKGLYKTLLADPRFSAQQSTTYFALKNTHWRIIGLDSAYYSTESSIYMSGNIVSHESGAKKQLAFLKDQVQEAQQNNQQVIIMTHHNGRSEAGDEDKKLWRQVTSCFNGNSGPAYWYWGHVHIGTVYKPFDGVRGRCVGHGGIPGGIPKELETSTNLEWFEKAPMPGSNILTMNGFAHIKLSGSSISESFYQQDGTLSWSS